MNGLLIGPSKRRLLGAAAVTSVAAALAVAMVCTAPAFAAATVFRFMEDDSGGYGITNPCNGEGVAVSGTTHLEFVVVMDGAGGSHFEAHYNSQDVTGQGSQGNTYQVPTSVVQVANVPLGTEFTFSYEQRFVSSGSGGNFATTMLVHFTINADGSMTSSQTRMSTTCTG
jgi:hypothetical protein